MPPAVRVPRATYRLQLHREFPLKRARDLVDYLDELGVSDLYASPLLVARPGSTHGYDVTDPTRLNPEIGTEAELADLCRELGGRGMGLLVDTVPNHLCLDSDTNIWWRDVLGRGRSSEYARYFDVYWQPTGREGREQVAIPVLGRPLEEVIAAGEFTVRFEGDNAWLHYYEHRFPLAQDSCAHLDRGAERPGPDVLRALLACQFYRLMYWRRTWETLGYRRFFDINELIGVRVEDPVVFDRTHERLLEWVERGWLTGLRIDHIDGLRAPRAYLRRLQEAAGTPLYVVVEKILGAGETLRPDWPTAGTTGYEMLNALCHLFVEPEGERRIRRAYAELTGAAPDPDALETQSRRHVLDHNLHGSVERFALRVARLLSSLGVSAPEKDALGEALTELLAHLRVYRTYLEPDDVAMDPDDVHRLEHAARRARSSVSDPRALDLLVRVLCLRPIDGVHPDDARDLALRFQQLSGPVAAKGFEDTALYRWTPLSAMNEVGGRLDLPVDPTDAFHALNLQRQSRTPHALTTTATHDTKRGEDTRLRIAVLSEIPEAWLEAVDRWRVHNQKHRTVIDGGGDGVAPDAHDEYLFYQTLVGVFGVGPSDPEEWRSLADRLALYMQKATREAKRRTSWWEPNEAYETAVDAFVRAALDPGRSASFLDDARALSTRLCAWKWASASQVLLKVTSPGVPDFYQGTEWVDSSLVDPDNRRPVDFARRRAMLSELRRDLEGDTAAAVGAWAVEGDAERLKLFVTHRCLAARRAESGLFERGSYAPVEPRGRAAKHLVGFCRRDGPRVAIVVGSRWHIALGAGYKPPPASAWKDTAITLDETAAHGRYRDLLTGRDIDLKREGDVACCPLAEAFYHLPFCLLVGPF